MRFKRTAKPRTWKKHPTKTKMETSTDINWTDLEDGDDGDTYPNDDLGHDSYVERMLDRGDYLRDEARDRLICPPDPSPEEIDADARDAAEDARTMAEDAAYEAWQKKRQHLIDEAFAIVEENHSTP
jgi:hypothetical protein